MVLETGFLYMCSALGKGDVYWGRSFSCSLGPDIGLELGRGVIVYSVCR